MTLFPNLFPLFVPRRFGPSNLAERVQPQRIEVYGEKVDLLPAIVTVIFGLGLQVGGEREILCADGSFVSAIGTSGLSCEEWTH
jgi:hypothetical protein